MSRRNVIIDYVFGGEFVGYGRIITQWNEELKIYQTIINRVPRGTFTDRETEADVLSESPDWEGAMKNHLEVMAQCTQS